MFQPSFALHTLARQDITAAQQREADEQLGEIAAAAARRTSRLAAQARAVAAMLTRSSRAPRAGAICD